MFGRTIVGTLVPQFGYAIQFYLMIEIISVGIDCFHGVNLETDINIASQNCQAHAGCMHAPLEREVDTVH